MTDPPLRTAKAWPLLPIYRRVWRDHPRHREFLWNVFGMSDDAMEDRDYSGLLQGLPAPTEVMCGEVPLMPERSVDALPSLLDEPERALLAGTGGVSLTVVPGVGHDVHGERGDLILDVLRRGLGSAER